ncbi:MULTISPECIES: patatin-like phospholipase family protein [unclassified Beijerinckia]|uniref:patatin-like phospholipase family protein n=1 Tax=unclassified Beijerinckia TaxID=2638183 RepID=UPI001FCD0029|nr:MULTISPECIES: patatin-like phospholipase family protein [unclassified Beijerinckia]
MKNADESGPLPAAPPVAPRRKIGLALGAGGARGWSHIGVLQELEANGLQPDVIAGASIGSVAGGCWAGGRLAELEDFARSLNKRRVFSLLDVSLSGAGLISGNRLRSRLDAALGQVKIEDLPKKFLAVATEMGTGHEIWLQRGPLVDAMRASYALPGIFEPVSIGGRWLFDGALVNPVPVTACRALGADFVISVNLIADTRLRPTVVRDDIFVEDTSVETAPTPARKRYGLFRSHFDRNAAGAPGLATAVVDAFNITQDRITRARLAGDPPDATIGAKLGRIGFFDFHRADEMIALGREAARKAIPEIREEMELRAPV